MATEADAIPNPTSLFSQCSSAMLSAIESGKAKCMSSADIVTVVIGVGCILTVLIEFISAETLAAGADCIIPDFRIFWIA